MHKTGKKYANMPKHRNSSFLSKTVKTGSHQGKQSPVRTKQYELIHHGHTQRQSCYTAVYSPHLRGCSHADNHQDYPKRVSSHTGVTPHHPRNVPVTSGANHTRTYSQLPKATRHQNVPRPNRPELQSPQVINT